MEATATAANDRLCFNCPACNFAYSWDAALPAAGQPSFSVICSCGTRFSVRNPTPAASSRSKQAVQHSPGVAEWARTPEQHSTSFEQPPSPLVLAFGVIELIVALAIFLWARNHSPHVTFFEALSRLNSYVIQEPFYSIILLLAAAIAILGVVQVVRGLQPRKTS